MSIEEKRERRLLFMDHLYRITDGDRTVSVDTAEVTAEAGIPVAEAPAIVDYLVEEGLVARSAFGGLISITHRGVVEVEESARKPDEPTEHFAPRINVVHVGMMVGSTIQQGTSHSTVHDKPAEFDLEKLKELLAVARQALPEVGLGEDDVAEAEADIGTIESQAASSRPKMGVIRSSLQSLSGLFAIAAPTAAQAAQLAQSLEEIHKTLPGV
ncbi:hypothetical protein COUCH_06560 [Couchioplanes caeruleus]|uniref:hypothetical protein n=1 Tax=Couchioplanes caeruleus TaxID=56438 RepID=UPI0020C0FDC4|nr:hypothetical protein [Couchioplanes caeruleus]UQU65961.1 hypothetical protein COUCH_06560 [Couchioplanes caeruleus]